MAELLADADDEIRAQAAKIAGELRLSKTRQRLIALLEDRSSRVRYMAAMSLGKLGAADAIEPVIKMLAENDNRDPLLRHAGVMAMVGASEGGALRQYFEHESAAVRIAIVVALRKLQDDAVRHFLNDHDPLVRLEAAVLFTTFRCRRLSRASGAHLAADRRRSAAATRVKRQFPP